jgi:hypothetical protein
MQMIIESWYAEIDLPPSHSDQTHGEFSFDFLEALFIELLDMLLLENSPGKIHMAMHEFIDETLACGPRRFACTELYRTGEKAFSEIINTINYHNDTFSVTERTVGMRYIKNSLLIIIRKEIDTCCQDSEKPYCPFNKIGLDKI